MKKIFLILCTSFIFLFTSCELLTYLLLNDQPDDYEEGTKTVKCDPDADIYLVKLNTTNEKIGASYTGKVTGASRSVDETFEQSYADTDSFIRAINESLVNVEIDSSRAASSTNYIKSDINELNFTEGGKYTLWSFTKPGATANSGIPGQVEGICKYAGEHCYVFADKKDSSSDLINLTTSDYKALGRKFDECYELEIAVLGDPFYKKYNSRYYNACNDKIVILVSDLFGDAKKDQENEGGTVGYFYPADLYNQEYLDNTNGLNKGLSSSSTKYIHSNKMELFYIDSYFLSKMPKTVYSTLVHEFNHMINYVVKTLTAMTNNPNATSFNSCDTWFTEMLSMVTEDMFQDYLGIDDLSSPKGRLPYFNNFYNYGFKMWNDNSINQLYMYANTYGFGAFLARNFGGVKLIKEIAQNPYVNEQAITKALQACGVNKNFNDVLRKYANCLFHITDKEDNTIYTFNKSAGKKADTLFFSAIDINNIKIEGKTYPPKYFRYNEQVDLYPYGFSVHYVGQNISSFTLTGSKGESINYFLISSYDN